MRLGTEQQHATGERLPVGGSQLTGLQEAPPVGMADTLGVVDDAVFIESRSPTIGAGRHHLEGGVAPVVAQFHPLLEGEPAVLIANAQKHFVACGGVELISRRDNEREQMVARASMVDALQWDDFKANRWLRVIDPGLPPLVMGGYPLVDALAAAVEETDHYHPSLRIGHRNQGLAQVSSRDPRALAVEPLPFRLGQQELGQLFRWESQQTLDGRHHGRNPNML